MPLSIPGADENLQYQYDLEETTTGVIYVGTAQRGALTSAEAWTIKRTLLSIDGNPTETKKTEATAVWDDRTTETYT